MSGRRIITGCAAQSGGGAAAKGAGGAGIGRNLAVGGIKLRPVDGVGGDCAYLPSRNAGQDAACPGVVGKADRGASSSGTHGDLPRSARLLHKPRCAIGKVAQRAAHIGQGGVDTAYRPANIGVSGTLDRVAGRGQGASRRIKCCASAKPCGDRCQRCVDLPAVHRLRRTGRGGTGAKVIDRATRHINDVTR